MSDILVQDSRKSGYAGVFDGKLVPGQSPALLVIDVCNAYLQPTAPFYAPAFTAALQVILQLVEAARISDCPVIFTRVLYQRGGIDGGLFYRKVPALKAFDEGSSLGAFPPEVMPREGEAIITKQYASAFFGTSLAATLTARHIDTLILTGFSTSGCVRATATDAIQHGFVPFVVNTACADRHIAVHEASLFDLQSKYSEVINTDFANSIIS